MKNLKLLASLFCLVNFGLTANNFKDTNFCEHAYPNLAKLRLYANETLCEKFTQAFNLDAIIGRILLCLQELQRNKHNNLENYLTETEKLVHNLFARKEILAPKQYLDRIKQIREESSIKK